jgi:hypothetical protein
MKRRKLEFDHAKYLEFEMKRTNSGKEEGLDDELEASSGKVVSSNSASMNPQLTMMNGRSMSMMTPMMMSPDGRSMTMMNPQMAMMNAGRPMTMMNPQMAMMNAGRPMTMMNPQMAMMNQQLANQTMMNQQMMNQQMMMNQQLANQQMMMNNGRQMSLMNPQLNASNIQTNPRAFGYSHSSSFDNTSMPTPVLQKSYSTTVSTHFINKLHIYTSEHPCLSSFFFLLSFQ